MTIRRKLVIMCSMMTLAGLFIAFVWYRTAKEMQTIYLEDISQSAMQDAYNAFDYILTDTQYMCSLISLNDESIVTPMTNIFENEVEENGMLNEIYLNNQRKIKEFIRYMNNYKYYIVGVDILSVKGYRFSAGHIVQNYETLNQMIAQVDPQVLCRSMVMLTPIHVEGTWLRLSSDFVVPSVRGILDDSQNLIGYTVLYFDYSVIEEMFSDHLPEGSLFQVQNQDNDLIFSSCGDTLLQNRDAEGYVYNTYSAPKAGWMLHMMIPTAVYTGQIQQGMLLVGGIVCGIFLLAMVVSTTLSRQISLDISGLRQVMDQVGEGDLSARYTRRCSREIAAMAATFNRMVEKLHRLILTVADQEKQKQEMELRLLQAQINPHFISNTLNVVAWMAKLQHADNIVPLTTALSRLLRSVMKQSERFVPLSSELEYVKSYLDIMEYSGNYIFDVVYDIDPQTEQLYVPRFILQPIVENALLHGSSNRLCDNTLVHIRSKILEGRLHIEIEDNGPGMSQEQIHNLLEVASPTTHSINSIGVSNVAERLRLYFGDSHCLRYESVLGEYTRVIFSLPCVNDAQQIPEVGWLQPAKGEG